ncbi:MAG: hypothetical protein AMXMBFR57_38910 [Acidimicrobiia bacterium]
MTPSPIRLTFLGCGYITRVHSRNLRSLSRDIVCSYASRDLSKAEGFRKQYQGQAAFGSYEAAIHSDQTDAVVVAVPPRYHLALTKEALAAGKHVVVEKPAFMNMAEYQEALAARNAAGRVVIVGENDHYKPLAVRLRQLLADDTIGDMLFGHFTTLARLPKKADDWRNDETMAGGDAFFEEGIHWLHIAGSLGPRIVRIQAYRPPPKLEGPDRRIRSMLVAFQYDNGAAGSLYYSREVPSLLKGLRWSKLFGRDGIVTFESNGVFMLIRGRHGLPRLVFPGFRDIRGYQAMYRDFVRAIRTGTQPEMCLERAIEDQQLMDMVYASL